MIFFLFGMDGWGGQGQDWHSVKTLKSPPRLDGKLCVWGGDRGPGQDRHSVKCHKYPRPPPPQHPTFERTLANLPGKLCDWVGARGPGTRLALGQMLQVPEPPRPASSQHSKQLWRTCMETCVIFLLFAVGGGPGQDCHSVECSKSPGPMSRQLPMFKTTFGKLRVWGRRGPRDKIGTRSNAASTRAPHLVSPQRLKQPWQTCLENHVIGGGRGAQGQDWHSVKCSKSPSHRAPPAPNVQKK